jgi:hypothetical protein
MANFISLNKVINMKLMLITVFFALLATVSHAQGEEKIRVHAGEDLMKAVSEFGAYRFAQFTKGTVFYKYNKAATALFNYNLLTGEMRFITNTGDTLTIANPEQVKFISVGEVVFYYDHGYQEVVSKNGDIELAVRKQIKIEYEKIGAYGQANTTSAIDNSKNYSDSYNTYSLMINQDAVVRKKYDWYLIANEGEVKAANKATFLKLFPAKSKEVETYIKTHDIKFNNEKQLNELIAFCNGL